MKDSDNTIYKAFQIAGAAICGVAGVVGSSIPFMYGVLPINGVAVISGVGAGMGLLVAIVNREQDVFEDMFIGKAVATMALGATGVFGIAGLFGAVAGVVAGSAVGFPIQTVADRISLHRARASYKPQP